MDNTMNAVGMSSPNPRLLAYNAGGPAKISRKAPAFAHVVPRRKEERNLRGSWVLYVVALLFITGVVVIPPTW